MTATLFKRVNSATVLGVFALVSAQSLAAANNSPLEPIGQAPRSPVVSGGGWSSGNKQIFGTAYESYDSRIKYSPESATAPISRVWFTGAKNIITEVYWPTLDRPQVRDSQFLVSDGKTFLWTEPTNPQYKIEVLVEGVPIYRSIARDPKGRFSIERISYTDPDRDTFIQKIKISRNVDGLKFYYLHNPAVGNTPMGDRAEVIRTGSDAGLYAWQNNEVQALLFEVPLSQVSAGFEGVNDGYQDLYSDFQMDSHFARAFDGNVVVTAALDLPYTKGENEFTIALGFGESIAQARSTAKASILEADQAREKYISQWLGYQRSVRDLSKASEDRGVLFRRSVALLKSMEDKTFEGGFVASPSSPWAQHRRDESSAPMLEKYSKGEVGGYHLVWPRDLYQMATTFIEIGDNNSAIASLNYLRRIQFGPHDGIWPLGGRSRPRDGSWVQNAWLDGTPYWGSLQMDQTAYPVILAYRLWQKNLIRLSDYWGMVSRASDFVMKMGPWTAQERWEENFGASPSTIASQISALWVASEMARYMGDINRAADYARTADEWSSKPGDNLEAWTFTSTGALGNGKYYQRIEGANNWLQRWDPNDEERFQISNPGGGFVREKDVIDGGFLELVRLGVRSALDFHVLETLHEYDQHLRVNTPRGPSYYRYLGDRYNYDDDTNQNTKGMPWPLLTGERGMYEYMRSLESGEGSPDAAIAPYIEAIENFSTPTGMVPEQVWAEGPYAGLPTGAATPLGWAHGEYLKLLSTPLNRNPSDLIPHVKERNLKLMQRGGGAL